MVLRRLLAVAKRGLNPKPLTAHHTLSLQQRVSEFTPAVARQPDVHLHLGCPLLTAPPIRGLTIATTDVANLAAAAEAEVAVVGAARAWSVASLEQRSVHT